MLAYIGIGMLPGQTQDKVEREVSYTGFIADALTHEAVDSGQVRLLAAKDSTLLLSTSLYSYHYSPEKRVTAFFVPLAQPGSYLLRVEAKGYQPRTVAFEVKRFYKNETSIHRERPIYLHRLPKERTLDELVVKASKVKFFQNGDTLVFNADAFEMPDGSLLDALIRQLPGAKLKPGGEIEVNGRRVDELLLNGKNFFNKDRELLLDNLPSYMVQSLNAYERVDEQHLHSGFSDFAERQYVMDVRLKREYQVGWTANAEAGGGVRENDAQPIPSSDPSALNFPFLARLFALRFTPHSRAFLYANANNLSDDHKPGKDGTWSPLAQRQGMLTTYDVGGNVYVEHKDSYWHYEGDARYTYSESDNQRRSNSQTFLAGGDTYGRSLSAARSYDHHLRSQHQLSLSSRGRTWLNCMKGGFLWLFPNVDWHQWHKNSYTANAEFLEDVADGFKEWTDSLMAPNAGNLLRNYALNRTLTQARGDGHSLLLGLTFNFQFQPMHNDRLEFQLLGSYSFNDNRQHTYDHYLLEYPAVSSSPSDHRNRFDDTFHRNHGGMLEARTSLRLGHYHMLSLAYCFQPSDDESNRSLYLLHLLDNWDGDLGTLPPSSELLQILDRSNSPHSRTRNLMHTPKVSYSYAKYTNKLERRFTLSLPLRMEHDRLDYRRGQTDTLLHHNFMFFTPELQFTQKRRGGMQQLTATYQLRSHAPSLTEFVPYRDDSNPLYITDSNPALTSQHNHELKASFQDRFKRTIYHADASLNIQQNAIVYALLYNRENGVRTITPHNINGNWQTHLRLGLTQPLDRNQHFTLDAEAWMDYNHSVDLVDASRSLVRSTYWNSTLRLDYRPTARLHIGVKGNLHTQRSSSDRTDFQHISVIDFDYGALSTIELPWDFQFATDLTMYSRRGYADPATNTNELVWNARLTKRFLRGNLLLQLDALDLLGQLSNVRRTINAQGRTETWSNVMPRYALLHVIYRLSKQPKRKQQTNN